MPAATVTMFCSATPRLKNRDGCRMAKSITRPAPARSALRTTMRSSLSARSANSWPAIKAGTDAASMPATVTNGLSDRDGPALPTKTSLICCAVSWSPVLSAIRGSDAWLETGVNLAQHVVIVGADQIADVPVRVAFHPLDPTGLDGVRDDELRRGIGFVGELSERVKDSVEIVSIDAADVPSKCRKLRVQRLHSHDCLGRSVDGKLVPVNDRNQRSGLEVTSGHRCFPHLTLGQFSVTEKAIGAVRSTLHSSGERLPQRDRQPVTQRTRTEVDARHLAHVGMVSEDAAEAGVTVKERRIKESDVCKHWVEPDRRVAFAQHESVPVEPTGIARLISQLGVIESDDQLGRRQRPAVVAGTRDPRESECLFSKHFRFLR